MLRLCGFLLGIGLLCVGLSKSPTSIHRAHSKVALADPEPIPLRQPCYNIIFISLDALQAKHVHSLGYPIATTPNIDQFVKNAYIWKDFHSVSSWTVPASMTWFTGVYPSTHRIVNKYAIYNDDNQVQANLKQQTPELMTLAEVFRRNDYATGGFTGNAGVSKGFGFQAGFDVYVHPDQVFGGLDESVPKALAWLQQHQDQLCFLFLHGYDCHGQFPPEKPLDYRFVEPNYDGKFRGSCQEQEILREQGLAQGRVNLRPDDILFWRAVYDEKIQRMDTQFGEFVKGLQKIHLKYPTIFVITSDHGTELFEHQRIDHGFTLYEELVHVPLWIVWPNEIGATVIEDRCSSIDIFPTLLEMANLNLPNHLQTLPGRSLQSMMNGQSRKQSIFAETDYREYTFLRSVTDADGWKLIVSLERRTEELYHLPTDPKELHNRVGDEPKIVARLREELQNHYRALGVDWNERVWQLGLNPVYPSQGLPKK